MSHHFPTFGILVSLRKIHIDWGRNLEHNINALETLNL